MVSGIRNFDTTTSKPAPWQPITTSPITSQELSKLAVGPTSAAGAPILRLYATTAVLPAILAPTGEPLVYLSVLMLLRREMERTGAAQLVLPAFMPL